MVERHGLQPAAVHQLHPAVAEVGDHRHQVGTVGGATADEHHGGGGGAGGGRGVRAAGVDRGHGGVSIGQRLVEQGLDGFEIAATRQAGAHPAVDRLGGNRRRSRAVSMPARAVEDPVQGGGGIDEQPVFVAVGPPAHTDAQFVGGWLDQPERQLQ